VRVRVRARVRARVRVRVRARVRVRVRVRVPSPHCSLWAAARKSLSVVLKTRLKHAPTLSPTWLGVRGEG